MALNEGGSPFGPGQRSAPPPPPPLRAARGSKRRLKVLFTTAVTIVSVTATLVVANIVSERFHARMDVTASGTQKLAPRTEKLLDQIREPLRIAVATDMKNADRRSRERVKDVLLEMKRSAQNVDFSMIDTGSVSGLDEYKRLLRELVTRDSTIIEEQTAAVNLAVVAAQSLATYLNTELSPSLIQVQGAIGGIGSAADNNRAYFEQAAAGARLASQDLNSATGKAGEALKQKLDDISMPATDVAARTVSEALGKAVDQLTELAKQVRRFAEAGSDTGAVQACRTLIPTLEKQRDQAAVLLESLRRLKRPDLLRVTDVLRTGNAALVIGPPAMGLAAMDLDSLMPSAAWLDATGTGKADLNRRVEELVTTAIASMLTPQRPVVVLVHAERPFFDQQQVLDWNFGVVVQRMQFRGMDVIEWAVMADAAPPRLAYVNPDNKRPVVYVSFPADSAEGSGETGANGVQRTTRMGEVCTRLVQEGKNLLLSVNPCILPTYGQPDPIAPALDWFGLVAESGRPLLREELSGQGRVVQTEHSVFPDETTGVLAGAIRGLPLLMPGPVAFHVKASKDPKVQLTPFRLYAIPASDRVWAESQWVPLWQTPRPQRHLMANQPAFDDGRDARIPQGVMGEKEPGWLVATAVERRGTAGSQRLVAVGSREWFSRIAMLAQTSVDGRTAASFPGNAELFESSVYWLAGQDQLIAQSPIAQTVALIQPMDEKVLSGLRTTMIVGLPLLVLALGLVYRLIRG